MKRASEKSKRRLEAKKRKVSAFLQLAELNDAEKRRKVEGSNDVGETSSKVKQEGRQESIWFLWFTQTSSFASRMFCQLFVHKI